MLMPSLQPSIHPDEVSWESVNGFLEAAHRASRDVLVSYQPLARELVVHTSATS